ncbi:hypothetical protein D3C79_830150 [compost metagenome]
MADLATDQRPEPGSAGGDPRLSGVFRLGHADGACVPRCPGQRSAAVVRRLLCGLAIARTAVESLLGLRRAGQCVGAGVRDDHGCRADSGRRLVDAGGHCRRRPGLCRRWTTGAGDGWLAGDLLGPGAGQPAVDRPGGVPGPATSGTGQCTGLVGFWLCVAVLAVHRLLCLVRRAGPGRHCAGQSDPVAADFLHHRLFRAVLW